MILHHQNKQMRNLELESKPEQNMNEESLRSYYNNVPLARLETLQISRLQEKLLLKFENERDVKE